MLFDEPSPLVPLWGPPYLYRGQHTTTALESWRRFWDIPVHRLAALIIFIVVMLLLDYWLLQKFCSEVVQLMVWIAVAVVIFVYIALCYDLDDGGQWLSGYAYEWVFQIDNLFVVHMILQSTKVPKHLTQLALFILLAGQIVVSFWYYLGLAHIIRNISWLNIVAGVVVMYLGYFAARDALSNGEAAAAPAEAGELPPSALTSCLTSCMGRGKDAEKSTEADERQEMFIRLVQALLCLFVADIFQGADCAITKIESIPGHFWNLSSSVIALFGIRSSYFVLVPVLEGLAYVQLGVGCVLAFLGLELLLNHFIDIGTFASLLVVFFIMTVSVVFSFRLQPDASTSTASKWPPAPEAESVIESSPDAPVASATPALGPGR